ncbi:nucleoside-diphosphate sugar epimerase/dehydratase [Brevundimonas sp. Root1423]|uniref:polysaccharide biosynthesis protein n=1 Tax=Brevundimonas sp. Root1423 TaxID=1736462 RepID=UPI0006F1F871|nr:nucleoside-diphosphate sugar epimerase/dehydratase [Brevundimonas sp. Root1423]KQY84852.1 capsular biosynthesis protein [Brevundimonas sp. Root1423]
MPQDNQTGTGAEPENFARLLLTLPRPVKRGLALAMDIVLVAASVWLAINLRIGALPELNAPLAIAVGIAVACALPAFITMGLYRVIFRSESGPALVTVLRAVCISSVPFILIITLIGIDGVPRTVGLIEPPILLLFIAGARAVIHRLLAAPYKARLGADRYRVLIYGAGSAGQQLHANLYRSPQFKVLGFLDDDPVLHGQMLRGEQIFSPSELGALRDRLGVTDILLALPAATRQKRAEIVKRTRELRLRVRTIPSLHDIAVGKVTIADLREIDIAELLGREAVAPDQTLLSRNVLGKTLLVTGAGGSIGSELCRQIVLLQPRKLVLVDNSEYALYGVHAELSRNLEVEIVPVLGSVADEPRMAAVIEQHRPHTIFHAAAYKHVPLVESNPLEGILNNSLGTLVVAEIAARFEVETFVLVSTDKAVRPTNVMGATKRLAELILQALAERETKTRFCMVRFGNVLGSSGSVVPLFRRQILDGGPVTLTHKDIIRYFMTIPEAAQLVIQTGAMAEGGEVFVLDMGEPVRIYDLARNMIELSGLTVRDETFPDGDIEILITGLRPGEKLYEELLIGANSAPTSHSRIQKAHEDFLAWDTLSRELEVLRKLVREQDAEPAIVVLRRLVPEYFKSDVVADASLEYRAV